MREIKYIFLFVALSLAFHIRAFTDGLLLAPGDGIFEFYPMRVLIREEILSGSFPFWAPGMFLGFPLAAAMQHGAFYPLYYLFFLFPAELGFNLSVVLHTALAGYFTFLYARLVTGNAPAAVVAGAAFSLLGFVPAHLQHTPVQSAAAWLPLTMYFIEKMRLSREVGWGVFAAFSVALQALSGHPQTLFQSACVVLAYCALFGLFMRGEERGGLRFFILTASFLGLGLVMALPQLMITRELSGLAFRASLRYDLFSMLSFPPHMLPSLLFPTFWGTGGGYWGPASDVLDVEGYMGALPIVIAAVAAVRLWRGNRHVRVWAIIGTVAFVLALGKYIPPLHKLMFHVPVYNLFRASVRHFFEIDFALSVLLAIGLARVAESDNAFRRSALWVFAGLLIVSVAAFLGLQALSGRISPRTFDLEIPELLFVSLNLASQSIYVPLILAFSYGAVLFFLGRTGKSALLVAALCLMLFADGIYFRSRFQKEWPKADEIRDRLASKELRGLAGSEGRAAFVLPSYREVQDMLPVAAGVPVLNSYDPLIIRDLSALLDMEGIGYSHSWDDLIANNVILSMLAVKYVIVPEGKEALVKSVSGKVSGERFASPVGPGLPYSSEFAPVYEKLYKTDRGVAYANKNVLPRAYPAEEIIAVGGIEDIRKKLYSHQANPRRQAMLSPEDVALIGRTAFAQGKVAITRSAPRRVELDAEFFDGPGFAVLADQHYPGWRAFVDGGETKIYKTNGLTRGVVVPPGRHKVIFKYAPVNFRASLLACGIAFGAAIFILRRRRG